MKQPTAIPLTPTLSQRERENQRLLVGVSNAFEDLNNQGSLLPLPLGEGGGEGDCGAQVHGESPRTPPA